MPDSPRGDCPFFLLYLRQLTDLLINTFDMKKISSFFPAALVLALSIAMTSCSPARFVRSSYVSAEMTDIALIEPLAYVETYDHLATLTRGLETDFNDSLSVAVKANLRQSITNSADLVSINGYIPLELDVANTLFDYVLTVAPNKELKANLNIPQSVGDLIRASGHRFALVVSVDGVAAANKKVGARNVARQTAAAVGAATAAALMGFTVYGYGVPAQSKTDMCIMVLDAENDNIAYFDRIEVSDAVNLTRPKYIDSNLRRLLKKCKFPLAPAGPAN